MQTTKMVCAGEGHYHKGYYIYGGEDKLRTINNPEWHFSDEQDEEPGYAYEDAYIFRMGACHLFSFALHELIGYSSYEAKDKEGHLIHSFCIANYHGQKVFIDVLGITTKWEEFWSGFPSNLKGIRIEKQKMDRSQMTEDELFGYRFARWIIEQNRDFYTLGYAF